MWKKSLGQKVGFVIVVCKKLDYFFIFIFSIGTLVITNFEYIGDGY